MPGPSPPVMYMSEYTPWDSQPDFKHEQKHFITISSVNIREMSPSDTF